MRVDELIDKLQKLNTGNNDVIVHDLREDMYAFIVSVAKEDDDRIVIEFK